MIFCDLNFLPFCPKTLVQNRIHQRDCKIFQPWAIGHNFLCTLEIHDWLKTIIAVNDTFGDLSSCYFGEDGTFGVSELCHGQYWGCTCKIENNIFFNYSNMRCFLKFENQNFFGREDYYIILFLRGVKSQLHFHICPFSLVPQLPLPKPNPKAGDSLVT